jgi:hypothetical protein
VDAITHRRGVVTWNEIEDLHGSRFHNSISRP